MPHELIHTSAVRGVALGTDGYCVVAETPGIPKPLRGQLERLSGYRHRVKGRHPDPRNNPVAVSHRVVTAGPRYHVLTRVADAGFDHTDRTNYLAHHLAFDADELAAGGPAWLALQPRVFQTEWPSTRPPETLPAGRRLPAGDGPPRRCELWEEVTGDAGWAGVLAAGLSGPAVAVLYQPGQPVLELIAEALALVPADRRWRVTFTTYYTGGSDCQWRFMPADSREAAAALDAGGPTLRLDKRMSGSPAGSLVVAARTGVVVAAPRDELTPQPTTAGRRPIPSDDDDDRRPIRGGRRPIPRDDEDENDLLAVEAPQKRNGRRLADDSPPRRTAATPLKPLLMGIAIGAALWLLLASLVELGGGKSLLQLSGRETAPEAELRKQLAKSEGERQAAEDKSTESARRVVEASAAAAQWKSDAESKGTELEAVRQRAESAAGREAAANAKLERLKQELGEAKQGNTGVKELRIELERAKRERDTAKADLAAKQAGAEPKPVMVKFPLSPGDSKPLPQDQPSGQVELLGWQPLRVGGGNEPKSWKDLSGKLLYRNGLLTVPGKKGETPRFWAGTVAKVKAPDGKPIKYIQLGEPLTVDGTARYDEESAKKGVFQYTVDVVPGGEKEDKSLPDGFNLGFAGEVKVRVGDEEFTAPAANRDKDHPTELDPVDAAKMAGRVRVRILPSGQLEVELMENGLKVKAAKEGKNPFVFVQADLVPAVRIAELGDRQPVVARLRFLTDAVPKK